MDIQIEHFVRLQDRRDIDYFEIRGKSLILYWTNVSSAFSMDLDIPVIGSIPGSYQAAASYIYEYYDKENIHWMKGMDLTVKVRVD